MIYYKVLKGLDIRVNPWVLIEGELFTELEYTRLNLHKYNVFDKVEISKRMTYISFGARFEIEGDK